MSSKKIIFIHLYNDRSGSPKVLADVIRVAKSGGFDYELITSAHNDGFLSEFKKMTRTVFYARSENKLVTFLLYIISQLHLFFLCLRYWNQDVLLYANTMMPIAAGLAGKLLGKDVVFHVHETSIRPALFKRFLRFIIGLTASRIIYVSSYLSQNEYFPIPKKYIIYNAVASPDVLSASTLDHFPSDGDFNVLMVCSLKVYKGVFEFIKLASIFEPKYGYSFTLVLNATSSEITDFLQKHNLNIPTNLTLYDRQDELSSFYLHATIVLNLTQPDVVVETFGLTIIEAMSYGLPVIVPPIGGPAEIVSHGIDGFTISCYELDKIAEHITLLRSTPNLYKSLSASALKKSTDFSLAEFNKNIYTVFNE